jgi:hypothetical protein
MWAQNALNHAGAISAWPWLEALEFGPCFVRHQYTQSLTVTNTSKIPAKFEVVPQAGPQAEQFEGAQT